MRKTSTMSEGILKAYDLSVKLSGKRILEQLNVEVSPGLRTIIVGPNGSGKTTLLNTLGGLLPYEGSLTLHDREIREWSKRHLALEIAFVRQQQHLAFDFTVRDLVALGRSPHQTWLQPNTNEDESIVREAIRRVDLDDFINRSALTLSGGELQRVFLAQALAQDADILLLDEPTTHLDVFYQFSFMERLSALADKGRTVLAVVHDLTHAARFADFLIVMSEGRIAASGPPASVLSDALLANVFRMDATLHRDANGDLTVQYRSPLSIQPKSE